MFFTGFFRKNGADGGNDVCFLSKVPLQVPVRRWLSETDPGWQFEGGSGGTGTWWW